MKITQIKAFSLLSVILASSSVAADYEFEDVNYEIDNTRVGQFYFHGSIGRSFGHGSDTDFTDRFDDEGVTASILHSDDDRIGWEAGIGVQITKYFGLEVSYLDLEDSEVRIGADAANYPLAKNAISDIDPEYDDGYSAGLFVTYPLNKYWRALGKVGMHRWSGDGDIKNENNVYYGLGVDRYFNQYINIKAEVKRYKMVREESEFLSIGIEYYFAGHNKPAKRMLPFSQKPIKAAEPVMVSAVVPQPELKPIVAAVRAPIDMDSDKDGILNTADKCPTTPIGKEVNELGCQIVKSITLLIDFETASDNIKSKYNPEIKSAVDYLKEHKQLQATIEGHTDDRGRAAYNQSLSEKRANSLRTIMIDRYGIASNRLKAVGYGESAPVDDNNTEAGRKSNRRVMITISEAMLKQ